ncbi:MAG: 16S rRNA (guanine(966)-N(2))-methyltransferase RsmD [Nitrospirota bacterium]
MRIIAGKVKGRKVKTANRFATRPTLSRVKTSLFDILGDKVQGVCWLDLYSGTGNIGLEALSRGAKRVVFVENNLTQIKIIKQNIASLNFSEEDTSVYKKDVLKTIENLGEEFDIVYLAPPFLKNMCSPTIFALAENKIVKPNGIIGVEHHKKELLPEMIENLRLTRQKRYGDITISFYSVQKN